MSAEGQHSEDKQLAPSEQRLKHAREEGQLARSRELASFLLLGAAWLAFSVAAPTLWQGAEEWLAQGLRFDAASMHNPQVLGDRLAATVRMALGTALPLLAAMCAAAALAPLALGGWNFTWKPLLPRADRLDPAAGLARLFSRQGWLEMAKMLLIVAILLSVAAVMLWQRREAAAALAAQSLSAALAETGRMMLAGLAALVVVLAVAAACDVPLQWWRHRSQLMMSHAEAKREARESDGDPLLKARIRQQQRAAASRRMMERVPTADVIVTNPTHYAVALKYFDGRGGAPQVVAKGADLVAERIRALGREHGVPFMEAPPLARALYRHVELDQEVPVALYQAVAQVLAYVFQLKRYREGDGAMPQRPEAIAMPPGFDPLEGAA